MYKLYRWCGVQVAAHQKKIKNIAGNFGYNKSFLSFASHYGRVRYKTTDKTGGKRFGDAVWHTQCKYG